MQQGMQEHHQLAGRIDTLVQEVSTFPDLQARATTEELVKALLEMYGEGLAKLLEITAENEASGLALIDIFARDEMLSNLFLLHGLHPQDIETRVVEALDEVRPYLKSHGGNVELVRVEDGIAHLRLEGSCHGCPSSTMTLKMTIEETLNKRVPDLEGLQVEGVTEPPARPGMPITFVPPKRKKGKDTASSTEQSSKWTVVERLESLLPGTLKVITLQNKSLLFCKIADTYYAYYDRCSSCNSSLEGSKLEGTTLTCSACEQQYDVYHAGRSLNVPDLFLEPVPLLLEDGKVKVALLAPAKDNQHQPIVTIHAR